MPSTQPANSADGVLVDISSSCGSDRDKGCLLQIAALSGTVQQIGGAAPSTSVCVTLRQQDALSFAMFLGAGKADMVIETRLLDGTDATKCDGKLLYSTEKVITPATKPVDAGMGGSDAR